MTDIETPTAAMLEDLLLQNGWTLNGPLEIEILESKQHGPSWMHSLRMLNTGGADIPPRLRLKVTPPESRESRFYQHASAAMPIPRCLALRAGSPGLILMEDLGASHTDLSDWPSPLPQQAACTVLDALARFHASSWTTWDPQTCAAELPFFLTGVEAYAEFVGHLRRDSEIYTRGLGAQLGLARQRLLSSLLAFLPGLWEQSWKKRLERGAALPIIHGDLNPLNVFFPRQPEGRVVLVDWEAHRRGLPTSDLAMLFGPHLCPEMEEFLPYLRSYHASLQKAGVRDYSFDDLLEDYQLALVYEVFFPIKLYSQAGILDQRMMDNAVLALESFSDSL